MVVGLENYAIVDCRVDRLIYRGRSRNLLADWGIGNAKTVPALGTQAEALAGVRAIRTDDVYSRIYPDRADECPIGDCTFVHPSR
jgi:hypothetical protein